MLLRRLGAALAALTGVMLIVSADWPAVRFASVGNSQDCAARQLIDLPQQIDVAVLGSSRIRRGISPDQLSEELGQGLSGVYNFGRPGRQIRRSESNISYLLDTGRTPKVVVLEADIDLFRFEGSGKWNLPDPEAGYLKYSELFNLVPPDLEQDYGNLWSKAIKAKIGQTVALHVTGLTTKVQRARRIPNHTVCWMNRYDRETDTKRLSRERKAEEMTAQFGNVETAFDDRFIGADSVAAQMELASIERVRARLGAVGARLIVIRPNGYSEPPLSDAVVQKLQALIPEFVVPPTDLTRTLGKTNIDEAHFGLEGRTLFTHWLAGVIKQEAVQQ